MKKTENLSLEERTEKYFLSIQNLEKIYPNGAKAVYNFNIDIERNEFIVIVGPSGCGKSTTLRMIAGLEDISAGDIYLEKELLNYRPSKDRHIAIVFQSYALYPQMTVYDNIAFPLRINKYPYPVINHVILGANEILDLIEERPIDSIIKIYYEALNTKATKLGASEYVMLRTKMAYESANMFVKFMKEFHYKTLEEFLLQQDVILEAIRAKAEEILAKENDELCKKGIAVNEKGELLDANGEVVIEYRKMNEVEIKEKVFSAARTLDLGEYLDRLPKQLSGGQMQRVALGRAIVKNVPLFMMDEPLSNLDAKLRLSMRSEIVKLHNLINATTIYVTHDQTEAMTMATRIVVMSRGFVQQIDKPTVIYNDPANLFVAKFIGSPSINIFEGTFDNNKTAKFGDACQLNIPASVKEAHDKFYKSTLAEFEAHNIDFDKSSSEFILKILSALSDEKKILVETKKKVHLFTRLFGKKAQAKEDALKANDRYAYERCVCDEKIDQLKEVSKKDHTLLFAIRPEKLHIRIAKKNETLKPNEIKVKVTISELLGSEYHAHFDFHNHDMVAKFDESIKVSAGDELIITFDLKDFYIFDPITGGRIL